MADLTALVDTWDALQQEKAVLIAKIGTLEMQMRNTMTAEEASLWSNDNWVVELKSPIVWDEQKLAGLGEFFSKNDLADLKNSVRVPKFNKTKLRATAKRGGDIASIINSAQSEGAVEIKVRKKGAR